MFFFDPIHFNPLYFVFIAPAVLLAIWAQYKVQSAYGRAREVPTSMTGAAAARKILDSAGLENVRIEMTHGRLSDHYDPRSKTLRLSEEVFQGRSAAAVGIAAHEAGHALQDAQSYAPLVVRNAAVPAAGIGSNLGVLLIIAGGFLLSGTLIIIGVALYSLVVFFQLVNLPVEFNASSRAKEQLAMLGIADRDQMNYVNGVLSAAAMTYVAATLTSVLTLLYYLMIIFSNRR